MKENIVSQKVKAFEARYMIPFKVTHKLCKKIGVQLVRVRKILNNEIEPTLYECEVFKKFLKLPRY